jgi:ubiquinone/menaquinone biosynthesis C-methylase UbiE
LRSGRPVCPSVPWEQDSWLESYRTWRPVQSHEMWRAAGIEPGHRPGLRVLDMACGCAFKSFVLAQADATVHITCLDHAEVLDVARARAERLHLLQQVTFLPADLHAVQFGGDQYDAALLGQIIHHLTLAQNQTIFQRVSHALVPTAVYTKMEPEAI